MQKKEKETKRKKNAKKEGKSKRKEKVKESSIAKSVANLRFIISVTDSVPVIAMLALGPDSGLAQLKNGIILGEFITKKAKAKDLLVPKYWSDLKQKVPSHS